MLTVGSLFAGIGGFDLGLERAGMRVAWQSEIDPYASAVLRKHWPAVPNHGDIRGIRAGTVEPVDLICGGFPCQDISNAGKRAGIDGARSGLWSEYARVIGELRPRYVIVENVAALLGRGLERVLGDLAALGFDAEWHCIPASAVGAPHRRDRLWIVANAERAERRALSGACEGLARPERVLQREEGAGGLGVGGAHVAHANERRMYRDCADAEDGRAVSAQGLERVIRGGDGGANVAHAERGGQPGQGQPVHAECPAQAITREAIDAFHGRGREQWGVEPDVGRVANGVPSRVDRLRCLGNAIVPQIAEILGRAIIDAEMRAAA